MGKYWIGHLELCPSLFENNWDFYKMESPLMYLTKDYREKLAMDFLNESNKGSVIDVLKNYPPIKYNPKILSNLTVCQHRPVADLHLTTIHKLTKVDVIMISYGSTGDLLPILSIMNHLNGTGKECILISHPEFEHYVAKERFYSLEVSSKDTMKMAMDYKYKGAAYVALTSFKHLTIMHRKLEEVLSMYQNYNCEIFCSHSMTLYKNFAEYYGKNWIIIDCFPLGMMGSIDSEPTISDKLIDTFYKYELSIPITTGKGFQKRNIPIKHLTTCFDWMVIGYGHNPCIGPLQFSFMNGRFKTTSIPENSVFINFGSCSAEIEPLTLYNLGEQICNLGYNVVIYDKNWKVVIDAKITEIVNRTQGKLFVLEHFNCCDMLGKCFAMICMVVMALSWMGYFLKCL